MRQTPANIAEQNVSDQRFLRARAILEQAVAARACPGASVAVTHRDKLVWTAAVGRFTYDAASSAVTPATIYDLASLTKVIATTAIAMVLYDGGRLRLDQPIVDLVFEFAENDSRRSRITIAQLLAHTSGLPGYARLFETCPGQREVVEAICQIPLTSDPGAKSEYSDLGFILLGDALERIAGERLDVFCKREIFAPLGMSQTRFCPPHSWKPQIPPTEIKLYGRSFPIQGEVHDENAWAMGGVAGHAGLFAPATDVSKFALCMLRGGAPISEPETVKHFTQRQESPPGTSRALGWDTPSSPSQSGKYFSPTSFGHLGFTGTSLWCDPVRQVSITLLTNRTWPDRSTDAIKQVRPAVHDAIIEALES